MNLETFEETRLPKVRPPWVFGRAASGVHAVRALQDTWSKYLKEGANVNLLTWNGRVRARLGRLARARCHVTHSLRR